MVTNRLGCLPVLVLLLTLSSLVTSRYLRMKREIDPNTTSINSSVTHSTTGVAEAENTSSTTLGPLALNVSATTDYRGTPDSNHTQQKYSAGTENLTVYQTSDNESTLYTQLPTISNSHGHISQAGSVLSDITFHLNGIKDGDKRFVQNCTIENYQNASFQQKPSIHTHTHTHTH